MFKYVYLIVGVCADEDVIREKGKPIMTTEERAECVRQCKWVDEVIVNSKWLVDLEYLNELGCKYIARDDTDLDVYCFPQAYRDHLDDVFGDKIKRK